MANLTPIVEGVITLAAALITTFLIPWLSTKLGAEKYAKMRLIVKTAVQAAEQIYAGTDRGAEKKAYVLAYLEERGMTLDTDAIENMIEAAVYELNAAKPVE